MKRNLVKILALSSIVFGIGACQPKQQPTPTPEPPVPEPPAPVEPEKIELNEAFKQTEGVFNYENKEVILENLSVYTSFGNTLLAGYALNNGDSYYLKDVKSLEIELPALPQWSADGHPYGAYAKINVQGTLKNVDGRPVLKDASCEVKAEAKYDPNTGSRIMEGDVSTYALPYYDMENTSRDTFDRLTVENSGALLEGLYQLATVPSGITNDAEGSFKVVFPGENINGEDPANEHAINVKIPKNVGARGVNFLNSFFADKEKGDFIVMDAFSHFDSTKGGMGLLFESIYGPGYTRVATEDEIPTIITSWSTIQARYAGRFMGVEVPDLGCDEIAYSYFLNDKFSGSVTDIVGEDNADYWLVDQEKAGAFKVTANAGSSRAEEAFEAVKTKAAALEGFVLDEDLSDEIADEFYYVLREGEGESAKVVAEIGLFLNGSAVEVVFAANRATDAVVNTFAEAVAKYESVVDRDLPGFESALAALPGEQAAAVSAVGCDWKGYEDVEGFGFFDMAISFNESTFADAAAWQAYLTSYAEALVAAGFKANYYLSSWGAPGYFNPTTGEVVIIELSTDDAEQPNGIHISVGAVLNASKAALHCHNLGADGTFTAATALSFCYDMWLLVFGEPAIVKDDHFGDGYYKEAGKSQILSYIENYILPATAQPAASNPTVPQEGVELYNYYVPSATEGKVIQIQVEVDTSEKGLVFWIEASEVAAQ